MKALKKAAILLCAGFAFTACEDDGVIGLNNGNVATVTFEGTQWESLIDNPQYNGELLYGSNASTYGWTDETTQLSGGMTNAWGGMYGFSEGGTAISNYVSIDLSHNSYENQLEVPLGNGSKNFAVAYCTASLQFKDGKARVIRSMLVSPTTYLLAVEKRGNGWAKALTETGDYLTLHIEADNGSKLDVDLARDGNIQATWKRIDMSGLGAVKSVTFTMQGSDNSDYGLKTPAYFAFDNVEIEL